MQTMLFILDLKIKKMFLNINFCFENNFLSIFYIVHNYILHNFLILILLNIIFNPLLINNHPHTINNYSFNHLYIFNNLLLYLLLQYIFLKIIKIFLYIKNMIFLYMLHNSQLLIIRVELNIVYLLKNEYSHISYIIHLANK